LSLGPLLVVEEHPWELVLAINRDKVEAAAIKLLQQGKYDKAIVELKKIVDDDPTDVRTLLKLGDTHVKLGNKKESISAYERAAGIYMEQGFHLKGVAVFKQILRVDANVPELQVKLAELYQQLGLKSDALERYQTVASSHESQGRPREALEMLKRMLNLDPDNLAYRMKLGELFAQQGLAAEATHELRSALGFLKTQQRFDDYVRVGEKLVQYDATALDVARDLAQIYLQRAQPSVALGKLQMCFNEEPRNVEILALIAQAFLDMQQVPKTICVFKEMAKIHASDDKPELAQRRWERVLELSPGDAEAEAALGRAPSAALDPRSAPAPAATTVPMVLFPAPAAVQPPAAVASPAPHQIPNAVAEQLGRLLTESAVYVKYGLLAKALEHLQKVFALSPDHIPALEKSFSLLQALGGGPEVKETIRRLVDAAKTQGHPRLDEWRAELARVESGGRAPPATTQVKARAMLSVDAATVVADDLTGDDISSTGTINFDP
jgi:tetratricopeptide (TPR) repeat protein